MGASVLIKKIKTLLLSTLAVASFSSFAIGPTGTPSISMFAKRCVSFFNLPVPKRTTKTDLVRGRHKITEVGALSYQLADGTSLTIIDQNWADRSPSSEISRAIEYYYLMQGEIYKRRLDKFKQSASKKNQKSSEFEYSDRTYIILNTSLPITEGTGTILGGIRVVISRNSDEKQPFQYDDHFAEFSRKKTESWAAEVGRLTANSKANPTLASELILTAGYIILQMPQVEQVYVHTSKLHTRLYGRMGLVPKEPVHVCDSLNCLMAFSREEISEIANLASPLNSILPH